MNRDRLLRHLERKRDIAEKAGMTDWAKALSKRIRDLRPAPKPVKSVAKKASEESDSS